jgi:hypothetical protein
MEVANSLFQLSCMIGFFLSAVSIDLFILKWYILIILAAFEWVEIGAAMMYLF